MESRKIVVIAALVVIVAAVLIAFRFAPQRRAQRAAAGWEYTYHCRACGAMYNTNTAALDRLIRQGLTADPEHDYRLFECEECGEIEAQFYDDTPREQEL